MSKPVTLDAIKHIYPFSPHYLTHKGLRLHYVDEGAGEPILFLHGNPTWSFYFRSLLSKFASQYRVIAPDHMGCGLSDKPRPTRYGYRLQDRLDDLEALLAHLNLTRPLTLVLHDWGGLIGVLYALRNLPAIGRIVLLNTAAFFPPPGKNLPLRLLLVKNTRLFAKGAVLGGNLFARSALFMAPAKRLSREVQKGLIAPYRTPQNRFATLAFVQDIPLEKKHPSHGLLEYADTNLHKLTFIPMLILWGRHDFVFDMTYYNEWRRRFPGAQAHLLKQAGHYCLEDAPEIIGDYISTFLFRHPLQSQPLKG